MRKIFSLLTAILFAGSMMATDYQLVTSTSQLEAGAKYVIGSAAETSAVFMGTKANTNNRVQTPTIEIADSKIVYQDTILKLELGGTEGHWTFATQNYHGTDGFLSNANSGTTNALYVQTEAREFTISFDEGKAVITSTGGNARNLMRYNSGSKCFACYASGQKDIYLYKEVTSTPEPAGDTYTVAGNPAAVFGEAWNPALAANDMVKQTDGTYKWEKTDLTLGAGTVEFKVVTNHSWDNASYPASNYQLAIAEAGQYTISITFEPANENKVSAVATKSGDAVVDPTAAVRGQFNGWDGGAMTLSAGKESASATVAIAAAGNYEFKMVINDGWRGNGYTFHRDFTSVSGLESNGDNMVLTADVAGDYTFTWTFANDSLGIVYPEKPIEPTAKYYLTGDSALVVDAGLAAEKAWDPMAIKSETDTFALSLKANQEYKLKLIEDGDWNGGKVYGYDALTVKADGLSADADGNIVFKLNTASAVQVVYFWEEVATDDWKMTFKLLGDFYVAPEPPVVEHTYTVAGGSDVLFGTTWAPANTDNDMVKQEDGTYKWEKTELTLPAGAIEFKVCEDHAWTTCWPAQNYSLAIAEAGIYTITITFNPAAEENKVAAVATKTGSAVVLPTIAMHGNFLGSWADTENFTVAEGNETASLTMTLAAGNYEFGMRIGGSGNWTANGIAFTRENNSAAVVAGQGNLTLAADEAGEYTFMWIYASNTLVITFPKTGTGIDNTADGIKAVKVLRDGQLLIIKGEKTFTIQGQLVK